MTYLFDLITPDTTVLTPNRRLAASLTHQLTEWQINQQKTCWQSVDILPLQSWLQRLWNEFSAKEMSPLPLLLSTNQKSILWEMMIRESSLRDALLQIGDTAKLAESAYELLQLWEIDLNDPILSSTEDGQAFQEWANQFQSLCKKNNWIVNTDIVEIIKKNILSKKITVPQKIILVGFTEISPQHKSLLDIYEKNGAEIIHYNTDEPAKSIKKISLLDEETEIRTMARWAKNTYEKSQKKIPYLIGCVIPKLETLRESVLHIFLEVFSPASSFTLDHTLLPFNISAGKNLLSFPIIRTAIELLKLEKNTIDLESMIHLLRSPFLGEAEQEKLKRSFFENRLKNANVITLSLEKLIKPNSPYHFRETCPALSKRIQRYLSHLSFLEKKLFLNEWANHFITLLQLLGWPGERSLNSEEYQITQRWLNLLVECSHLDIILEPQSFSEAIHWLIKLTKKTIFQAQTPEAPIQILGMLEAAEIPFEHVWAMGLDDTQWPQAPKPNPLIPARLQKIRHMPHATVEREFIYCESLLRQFKMSAKQVIFSYSEKLDDIHLRQSALLNDVESMLMDELSLSDTSPASEIIFTANQLEQFIDETAPAIHESENIRGGTHILKQQAACPFKAFSELRLHARSIETPTIGLRPIDRGNIVHKSLELIWLMLKNSTTLIKLSYDQLKEIIHTCSKQAISEMMTSLEEEGSNKRYLLLELQRLEKILFDWLILESQRPEFNVLFQEHEMNTQIGNLPMTIRIDRIDELADGSQLVIDYKTGKYNEIKKWFGERPDEPQLPFYCLQSGENISGIAFGQLHPDDMTLLGVSKKNLNIKSIKTLPEISYATKTLWDQQLQHWKEILDNLSHDFCNGIAHVDPKDIHQTCNNCKLHTFCRVHEKC